MGRAGQIGQATVEGVGITLAVAALLLALVLWAGRAGPVPASPPVGLDPLTALLEGDAPGVGVLGVPAFDLASARGSGDGPIGRVIRGAAHVVRIGAPAFARGAADRLRERLRALVRHPIRTIRETLRQAARDVGDPVGTLRSRVGDLVAYAESLRGLSGDAIVRRVAHDLGGVTTDVVISRIARFARARVAGALTGAAGGRIPPSAPAPSPAP